MALMVENALGLINTDAIYSSDKRIETQQPPPQKT